MLEQKGDKDKQISEKMYKILPSKKRKVASKRKYNKIGTDLDLTHPKEWNFQFKETKLE